MLAEQLENAGHEVNKLETKNIPIKNLKNPSFTFLSTLRTISTTERYDIVHAFNIPSGFPMHFSKADKKILSVHGVFSEQIKQLHSKYFGKIAEKTEKQILRWADHLTTDSKFSQNLYFEKTGKKFDILPTPIDSKKLDELPNIKKNSRQIIYLGRDSYEKGIDIIRKIENQIDLDIIYSTNLKWVDAMKNLMSSSIMVVPSRIDSLPTNIKEAFYLKIPVIATNVGGIPELIQDKQTGILIPPEDENSFIEGINLLLNNPELTTKIVNNAYDFVEKSLTWKNILPKYLDYYKKALNEN